MKRVKKNVIMIIVGMILMLNGGCFDSGVDDGTVQSPSNIITNVNSVTNQLTLTWNSVDGAETYKIYQSRSAKGNEVEIDANVVKTGTSYVVSTLQWGVTYYIRMKSVSRGAESIFSEPKSIMLELKKPFAPEKIEISTSNNEIGLRWNNGNGAYGYKIFQADGDTGIFSEITPKSEMSAYYSKNVCSASNLTNGKKYVFKIKSVNSEGESDFSSTLEGTPWNTDTVKVTTTTAGLSSSDYVIVSNESESYDVTESTGFLPNSALNAKYGSRAIGKYSGLSHEAMRIDPILPETTKEKRIVKRSSRTYNVGEQKQFWTYNFVNDQNVQIYGTLLYIGNKIEVWAETPAEVSSIAKQIADEYDNKIYGVITNNFGNISDVDGNGRVIVLLMDIQDGWIPGEPYTGGYFYSNDIFGDKTSNGAEIFYMDTYPSLRTDKKKPFNLNSAYTIMTHEMQHMANYNELVYSRRVTETNKYPKAQVRLPPWIDEGMSMAAEQIYGNNVLQDRIDYYNITADITNGHSLLFWDNDGDVLSNYALSYLFMQYFKIRCGQGDSIFKEILSTTETGNKSIEKLAQKYISSNVTMGKLMTDFRIALFLKQSSGPYGFNSNTGFEKINSSLFTGTSADLRGGGAVIKAVNGKFQVPVTHGSNIKYISITK